MAKVQENEKLAEKYNPQGIFPYIILIDTTGKILKTWEKYPSETLDEFIEKMK